MSKYIKEAGGEHYCRRCLNERYRVDLQPSDCRYWFYPDTCAHCKNVGNVVNGFKLSGHIKLLRAKWSRKK